jgi:CRISPR-associated protein Csx10
MGKLAGASGGAGKIQHGGKPVKYYALTLRADSPLAIRADHAPGGAASAQYIPGTALAGSLAAAYRLFYPDDDTGFQNLFLNEQVWFPNLYPASFKKSEIFQNDVKSPIYPLPKTAQSCKRFPGFRPTAHEKGIDEPRHGVRDTLIDWAMFALADQLTTPPDLLLQPLKQHKYCEVCRERKLERPMDHFPGYYRRLSGDSAILSAKVGTRLQTHNGINRMTGTVEEGILYNREVIEEDAHFWGLLQITDDFAQPFQDFIEKFASGEAGWLRVGTGRTRGLGKVGLEAKPVDGLTSMDKFRERLEGFNTKLQERAKQFNLNTSPFYFAITLHSPVILCNDWQGYYTTMNESILDSMLPASERNLLQLIYQFSSTRRVTGWNELWGTPRMNELAIDTGSVFLFASKKKVEDTGLVEALYQLEEAGIGRRKVEGFGRICVSDRFHQEVTLV